MKKTSILLLVLLLGSTLFAQKNSIMFLNPTLLDQPDFLHEPQSEIDGRMQWFDDAKYGMFIHFGLYSQLEGEWEGEIYKEYAEWIQANADIPTQVYAMLTSTFNPKDFNAEFIAKTAKAAGMKYIVITTKHHEGFCLWDSEYTNFDVASTPFAGRDILAELSAACKKYDLKFCTYYSIIDWHHPSQERNIDGNDRWGHWGNVRMKSGKKAEYITYMKNQIRELVENYDTEMLWFDGDWVYWWDMASGEDLYQYIRELKPDIIINNRVAKRAVFKKDFGTPEQKHPGDKLEYRWEACYTLNHSWGFKKDDTKWKNAETVYNQLQDINTKGGNFLLNIGPKGDGSVPQESIDILLEVGEMLEK
jgi:alpha-L-fucosidase